jgi:peptide/nickel transport system substrate-binding protein
MNHSVPSRALAAVALACFVFAACSRAGAPSGSQQRLTIGIVGEPSSLNPLLIEGASTALVCPLIFSYLLTANHAGTLVPDLASEVPTQQNGGISRDGMTITYHLRHGAVWQDGAPVTSADVVFTYKQVMNPNVNVPSRAGFDKVASVGAPDPYTVVVKLQRPYAGLLSYFFAPDQNYVVLPKHILEGEHDLNHSSFNTAPIGSGPYKVVQWLHGDSLRLARNERYFRGKPAIPEIVLKFVPNQITELNQMRTRELDAVFFSDTSLLKDYEQIPNVVVRHSPLSGNFSLVFNVTDPLVGDLQVRKGIAQGLDFAAIAQGATHGVQTTANAGRGIFGWAYDPSIPAAPAHDVVAANKLLDAAGWPRGKDGLRRRNGVPVNLTLIYEASSPNSAVAALIVQQQLRALGVGATLHAYSPEMWVAPAAAGGPLFGGKFQLAVMAILGPDDPDVDWFLNCKELSPNGFNVARLCDPKIDEANAQGLRTYDLHERQRYSSIIQGRVAAELPFVGLWQQAGFMVLPPDLEGVNPSPLSAFWNVGDWRFR